MMSTRSRTLQAEWSRYAALLIACTLGGVAYGATNPTFRLSVEGRSEAQKVLIIEPFGQDIDGDGVATLEEGIFDIDGDNAFANVEAEHLGNEVIYEVGRSERLFRKQQPKQC